MVEEDLYRSGQPNELNFPFLEKLQLKTILFLAAEDPSQALYVDICTSLSLFIIYIYRDERKKKDGEKKKN